jgi:hypothetical protein
MKSIGSSSSPDRPSFAAAGRPPCIVAGAAAAAIVMRWLLPAALIVALIITAALWMAGPESPAWGPIGGAREPASPYPAAPDAPPPDAPAGASPQMRDLEKQRQEAAQVLQPPRQADAEAIEAFQLALADSIRARRQDAQRGDLLDAPLVAYITDITRALLEGEKGARILETLRENNPADDPEAGPAMPELAVNAVYPEDIALSMVPPSLLALYPPPPEGIEYRFVGCRLILMDRDARLILDYTEECIW